MIIIKNKMTLQQIEHGITSVNKRPAEILKWPSNPKHISANGEANAISFIMTWARKSPSKQLNTYLNPEKNDRLEGFVRNPSGLLAAVLANKIIAKDGQTEITSEIKGHAFTIIDKLDTMPRRVLKGQGIAIIAADHLGKLPHLFYNQGKLRSEEEFDVVAKWILNYITPKSNIFKRFEARYHHFYGKIIYELFRNTSDHGKLAIRSDQEMSLSDNTKNLSQDEDDLFFNSIFVRPKQSVRGLLAKKYKFKAEDLSKLSDGYPAIENYLKSVIKFQNNALAHSRETKTSFNLLITSIFDMGPGYAASLGKRDPSLMTIEEEYAYTVDCFKKHLTAKGKSNHGFGLDISMHILKELRGCIILRTGRLLLLANPKKYNENGDNIEDCIQWLNKSEKISLASRSTGTTLSVVMPL